MTKHELSQLKYLKREIKLMKKEIAEAEHITTVDIVTGSEPVWPYTRRTYRIEGIDEGYIQRRERRLRRKLEELMDKREEIEEYISTIPDSQARMIFQLRYVNGLSWRQVAAHIGGGNTTDGVRMIHNRYLEG
jgi:hypothetical protein